MVGGSLGQGTFHRIGSKPETWRKPTNEQTNERMNDIDEMIQRIEEEHTVPGKTRHTMTHSYIHPCIYTY